jgi:hypothetical protein
MNRRVHEEFAAMFPRGVVLAGTVTIGAAGAISAQDGAQLTGGTASKTGGKTGRYGIAFQRKWKRTLHVGATMVGPDDSAFPTTTGSSPKARLLAVDGFSVQFVREDTQADADPASGTKFTWIAVVASK